VCVCVCEESDDDASGHVASYARTVTFPIKDASLKPDKYSVVQISTTQNVSVI